MAQTSLYSYWAGNFTSHGFPGASERVLSCSLTGSYCTSALGRAPCGGPPVQAISRKVSPASAAKAWRLFSARASRFQSGSFGSDILGGREAKGSDRSLADECQAFQWPGMVQTLLAKQAIHQQQPPTIG